MTSDPAKLILRAHREGVTTLTMNMPARLNGWTLEMMMALREAFRRAAEDEDTRAVIITGTDPYYSAGVNLSGTVKLQHPRALRELIREQNQALFDLFIGFPKPLLAAVNGPAIGASVTSATLCDGLIASDKATFSTPFARLDVPHEGCSSEMFPKLLGEETAERILGREGWVPTGTEAQEIGLAQWVVPHAELLDEAQRIAEGWAAERTGRAYRGGFTREQLEAINAAESERVADAFLSAPFLRGQYRFLWKKNKRVPAAIFFALCHSRPLWSRLL
ncbi:MAG: enoyl-CoA hydratase/isomerase family protein [Deltaproteobacteria bacterium]|jgi:enoyl-CoA hydratase/carnithine racemase|nr:enoyl-CoA hydratase/isomerase family protein [Deltaproteobacteria bacterium]MBW2537671.1 enoyl-CoA hydratase/isomerase family protein [Deltaproteobacteria bacterium]